MGYHLGVILEALSKAPYEPLRKASLEHLTYKIVFLLAISRQEDIESFRHWCMTPKYTAISTQVGALVSTSALSLRARTRSLSRRLTPGSIQQSVLGRQRFGVHNCPVTSPWLYHCFMKDPPELWKNRQRLLIPVKGTNPENNLALLLSPGGSAIPLLSVMQLFLMQEISQNS